jgi:hypothetical protein
VEGAHVLRLLTLLKCHFSPFFSPSKAIPNAQPATIVASSVTAPQKTPPATHVEAQDHPVLAAVARPKKLQSLQLKGLAQERCNFEVPKKDQHAHTTLGHCASLTFYPLLCFVSLSHLPYVSPLVPGYFQRPYDWIDMTMSVWIYLASKDRPSSIQTIVSNRGPPSFRISTIQMYSSLVYMHPFTQFFLLYF